MKTQSRLILNEEQNKAVIYNTGPLLIIAGAGTGKTHTLVEKITYLIHKHIAKPEQILALTFTEKAAAEMEERVDQAIPYGYFQMWISTFHAFCDAVLKDYGIDIGLNPSYHLFTEPEALLFLKQNLFLFNLNYYRPLGNPHKFVDALLKHFSRLRDEIVSPKEYMDFVKKKQRQKDLSQEEKKKYMELAGAYATYQSLKIKQGFLDFSDLIYYTIQLFKKRKNVLENHRKIFTHVMVDEFQDTNIAQYELIKMLCPASKDPHLTVVGDDSQAIYKFRGASISNILNFMKDYPKAKQVFLQKNYRSNQTILNAAYSLIKHNDPDTLEAKLGISKYLISQKKDNREAITVTIHDRPEQEAEFVAKTIASFGKKYHFSDIAILTRAHSHADPFIQALVRLGIPYQFLGPGVLFRQPEVKDLIAYLKVLYNPEDSVSLYRVLAMDIIDIEGKDIALLLSFSKKTNLALFQSIEIYLSYFHEDLMADNKEIYEQFLPHLKAVTQQKLYSLYSLIVKHLSLATKETAGQILYYFLEDTKYLNKLVAYKTEKEEKIANSISKFFSVLKSFETTHEDASIHAVVDFLGMSMELGESPFLSKDDLVESNAVNILTVHAAKGLEFRVVFMINCTRGRFPTYQRKETIPMPEELIKEILPLGDYHLEEERRLFYVGSTRAMDLLYLSASKWYGEAKREQKLSPFVLEAVGEQTVNRIYTTKEETKSQLAMFAFEKPKTTYTENGMVKKPLYFSYTQLETYEQCPLQYKYRYVLKIPTQPSASASFGSTVHKALLNFYKEYLRNKNVTENRLLELYQKSWIPIGYSSRAQEKRMFAEGKVFLTTYFKKLHKKNLSIIDLEKPFKLKLSSTLYVTGKIDRIDKKSVQSIEIIDYKTGKIPADKELKKNLQLSIYSMAAMNHEFYKHPMGHIYVTLYYLQGPKKITMTRTNEEISAAKTRIQDAVDKIFKNNFEPNVGLWCDFCPFRMLCEAWQ